MWRRWLGYKVDNDGGEQAELAGEGRMCLPAVFLHPVKGVGMGVEGGRRVKEEGEEVVNTRLEGVDEGSGKESMREMGVID